MATRKKMTIKTVVVAALTLISVLPAAAYGRMVVNAETTLLIDSYEPEPLQKAAADLATDLTAVFGRRPKIVHDPSGVSGTAIWIALERNVPKPVKRPSGWEQLRIQVVKNGGSGSAGHDTVILTGSDVRGAIYAVYQFSQQFLGVDPLYWWTDHAPRHRKEVVLPDALSLTDGPTFHYRGWFLNDEDLLTGWNPGGTEHTGISLATWDRIFEAILRLKGDLVIPGTFIFPDEPQVRAAGERGLIVTQHHVTTVGLNTYRWPRDTPMSYSSNPGLLESAWRRAVGQYPKDMEILWSVGFRGKNDQPFWTDDPTAPATDEGRAQIIQKAIVDQMNIVRKSYPQAEFITQAWAEATSLIHEGALKIPDGITLIWTDNGHGSLQDHNTLASGQGEYDHTAMYDYLCNHYSEMVPIARIRREIGRAARIGATRLLLINTANVRPVVMTTRAEMELAWSAGKELDPSLPVSDEYLSRWSREEFGPRAAPQVAEYYKAYFKAPAQYGPREDATAGDNFYATAARILLVALLEDKAEDASFWDRFWNGWLSWNGLTERKFKNMEEVARLLREVCGAADERWRNAKRLAEKAKPLVSRNRRDFFQANVLTQVDLHLHFNRMVIQLAEMAQAPDRQDRARKLRAALVEGESAAAAMHAAEYGKWKGFYTAGDWLVDTPAVLALARAYLDQLEGQHSNQTSWTEDLDPSTPGYSKITAYQGTRLVEF